MNLVQANPPAARAATLAEQAYVALKQDIMSGELAPGQPLRLEFLKNRYDLSFTPLREALNRLQSERLVESAALRGFRVTPLSIEEMRDAMSARTLIDCEALERAIDQGGDAWETGIVGALHALDLVSKRQADSVAPPAYDEVEQRHLALHRALIAACHSRWLMDFSMALYIQTERYRRPMLMQTPRDTIKRDVSKEHHAIVDATLSRDKAKAVALLVEHYENTARLIETVLADKPAHVPSDA